MAEVQRAMADQCAMNGQQSGMSTTQKGMLRAQALEAAIRVIGSHGHPELVLDAAKQFEAYLTGEHGQDDYSDILAAR